MSWLIVISAYFIGSIPTAYIAGRLLKGVDIREVGDRNMGAQNAFRQLGPGAGITVGLIDFSKGALPIMIAQAAGISLISVLTVGLATVIGHNWPVFIGFRGGRGESATIGILLVLMAQPVLIVSALALAVLFVKKNVTLASAFLFVPLPLLAWWMGVPLLIISYGVALPCLVAITHLVRMRQGLVGHV